RAESRTWPSSSWRPANGRSNGSPAPAGSAVRPACGPTSAASPGRRPAPAGGRSTNGLARHGPRADRPARGVALSSATIEIGALAEHLELVADELHLVELAPRVVERAVQDHHQPAVESGEQHAVTAVVADQWTVLFPRPREGAGRRDGVGLHIAAADGAVAAGHVLLVRRPQHEQGPVRGAVQLWPVGDVG